MRLALLIATLVLTAAGPAGAESLASSAAGSASTSVGSLSDSLRGSSASSEGERHAEGRYKVTDVARADAGRLQLTLQAEAQDGQNLTLTLPEQALAGRALAAGDLVEARPRPYGTEFAYADTRAAFFLVLDDDWHGELAPHQVRP